MPPETLTPEHILEATEDVLRRYGPAKATVVDVARVLGVSHGSVYRHFPSKAALHAAVAARWLDRTSAALEKVAAEEGPADVRLRRWLAELFDAKRHKAHDDPEMFATYMALIGDSGSAGRTGPAAAGAAGAAGSATVAGVVARHVAELTGQLTLILEDGVRQGVLSVPPAVAEGDAEATAVAQAARRSVEGVARAVFDATRRFHDPAFAPDWEEPGVAAEFALVVDVVVRGLRP
ncbi:TetR/AcrR family transcriptional regulator [Streptomyces sp. NBC_01808]|uniref:TetR/AcrR family transcriptional regulator n=1 Tax=Streptomyces sp. NBC_01808 TaxID=2975947 RepID=UPI002DD87520|nr:TetR/AcrR family transcriptional regulator [Streptomyces sp. NBC_01808]WSA37741.1 TetR/AcrR family transcriptional regulator [Streptomyces sp. NBC_01808]